MAIPTPAERPDLYDDLDCRPESNYPEANSDAVTPDYVKQIIAERRTQIPDFPVITEHPAVGAGTSEQ